MKKSINAWSVDNSTDFKEMFVQLECAGFDAVELNLDAAGRSAHSLTLETTDEELIHIRHEAESVGIEIAGVSSSLYGIKLGNPETHDEAEKIIMHHIHCAKLLGVDSILVVPGANIAAGHDILTAHNTAFAFLNKLKPKIEEEGVYVCLENVWNGFFTSPFDMASFIDRLDSPFIKAYYDVGNTIAFSDTVSWIRILGNRIKRVHIKGFKRNRAFNNGGVWVDIPDADVDWKIVVDALKEAGYDGYLTAEVSPVKAYDNMQDFYRDVAIQESEILNLRKD